MAKETFDEVVLSSEDKLALILDVTRLFFGLTGKSSLAVLGPGMVNAETPVGLLVPHPRPRRRGVRKP